MPHLVIEGFGRRHKLLRVEYKFRPEGVKISQKQPTKLINSLLRDSCEHGLGDCPHNFVVCAASYNFCKAMRAEHHNEHNPIKGFRAGNVKVRNMKMEHATSHHKINVITSGVLMSPN